MREEVGVLRNRQARKLRDVRTPGTALATRPPARVGGRASRRGSVSQQGPADGSPVLGPVRGRQSPLFSPRTSPVVSPSLGQVIGLPDAADEERFGGQAEAFLAARQEAGYQLPDGVSLRQAMEGLSPVAAAARRQDDVDQARLAGGSEPVPPSPRR